MWLLENASIYGGTVLGQLQVGAAVTFFFFFHLTYSRWTSSLPSCLWSQRIFPSLPGSRLTIFLSRCKFSTLTTRQPIVESKLENAMSSIEKGGGDNIAISPAFALFSPPQLCGVFYASPCRRPYPLTLRYLVMQFVVRRVFVCTLCVCVFLCKMTAQSSPVILLIVILSYCLCVCE